MTARLLLMGLMGLMAIGCAVQAAEPQLPAGLLPAAVARPLLDQDPGVASARAGLEVARLESELLGQSPYEWTANASGQRRRVSPPGAAADQFNEWSVGLEKTLRLPGKSRADGALGRATLGEAEAKYRIAVRQAALSLLAHWVDWQAAEKTLKASTESLNYADESLATVKKRLQAGDASQLEVLLAQADLVEQQRTTNDHATLATAARLRLVTRFPDLSLESGELPSPVPVPEDEAFWRERVITQSAELRLAESQLQAAQARADRARAEQTPDPTLGVFTASEGPSGEEQLIGVSISIPLPGGARALRASQALAATAVSQREIELLQRKAAADLAAAVATARGAYGSHLIAQQGAQALQTTARLIQRAYALGEASLQDLLLARRQTAAAQVSAIEAQKAALLAQTGLAMDARLLWELDRD